MVNKKRIAGKTPEQWEAFKRWDAAVKQRLRRKIVELESQLPPERRLGLPPD